MPQLRRRKAKWNPFNAANYVNGVSFTVGAVTGGNAINVAMVLNDANGNAIPGSAEGLTGPGSVLAYLSDNADGSTLSGTAPTSVAIGTNGVVIKALTTAICFWLISNGAGLVDLTITKNAAHDWYLVLVMPDGHLEVSPIIHIP